MRGRRVGTIPIDNVKYLNKFEAYMDPVGAKGSFHYNYEIDDNWILKMPKLFTYSALKNFKEHIGFMKLHPKIFAKVKLLDRKRAAVEKLDTTNINTELIHVFNILKSNKIYTNSNNYFSHFIKHLSEDCYIQRDIITKIKEYCRNSEDKILYNWINFIQLIIDELPNRKIDIHENNIGYNKNGELRLLDF